MIIKTEHKTPDPPTMVTLGCRVRGNDKKTVQVSTVTRVYLYDDDGSPLMGEMVIFKGGARVVSDDAHRYELKNKNLVFSRYSIGRSNKGMKLNIDAPVKYIRVTEAVAAEIIRHHGHELDIREAVNDQQWHSQAESEASAPPSKPHTTNDFVGKVEADNKAGGLQGEAPIETAAPTVSQPEEVIPIASGSPAGSEPYQNPDPLANVAGTLTGLGREIPDGGPANEAASGVGAPYENPVPVSALVSDPVPVPVSDSLMAVAPVGEVPGNIEDPEAGEGATTPAE